MDSYVYSEPRFQYYIFEGDIHESSSLKGYNSDHAASGVIETTDGKCISFEMFHAYTSVEGFAAYVDNDGNTVLINRAHIQRILIS